VADTYDDCLETCGVVFGLEPPMHFRELDSNTTLVGAIKLNKEEVILASQDLRRNVRVDDAL
jgi:hypothetical protein